MVDAEQRFHRRRDSGPAAGRGTRDKGDHELSVGGESPGVFARNDSRERFGIKGLVACETETDPIWPQCD